ncbi:RcnB family protein [Piscinibacter koreensis]|uniref:RcnB family protein n=1 Tax=Piscinibacter koreensis TaxID=2742824 RepID=A0A7Y6TWX5_9BURK|nr:RcnB family protein [Schlegelella koreensis]NUZ06530.1 RcnB family protein [Schlegelella koreensis]
MKTRKIVSSIAALALMLGSAATLAQPRGDHDRGGRDRGSDMRRGGDHDRGDHDRGDRGRSYTRDRDDRGDRRGRDGDRWREARRDNWSDQRRFEQRREWHRGGRLPPEYRTRHYVVDDWRGHRLRQPPRGYHWVQHGSDYLLVAIASGVIADLIINH